LNVGVVLPVFEDSPNGALDVARDADAQGIDGVFTYDHLFPMGRPDRPALSSFPTLAAVASVTSEVRVGSLVSRVTLLPVPVLVDALVTIDQLAGGRLIAGLGTGDRLTAPENAVYGLPFPPAAERLGHVEAAAVELRGHGVRVWVGGRSLEVRRLAGRVADGWNCWGGSVTELASFSPDPPRPFEVTWGGAPPADGDLASHLRQLATGNVAWVIYGPPPPVDWPVFVAKLAEAAQVVH
jgi:alkanesulfonate monooxygenase SsuD/methylene tetrahydromethanopterin reductase-like flavin-dependent oxidoreductase (luciferase family)